MKPGFEPIADEELIYRRIPVSMNWYSPEGGLSGQAFHPNKNDETGISVYRAKYVSIEEAANGRPGKSYFVVVLKAGDLRQQGIKISPAPNDDGPGHAELPDLNYANRKDDRPVEIEQILAQLSLDVRGPFSSAEPTT